VIIYLHGFRSSPLSRKATQIRTALEARGLAGEYVCPALPASPRAAVRVALAAAQMEDLDRLSLIGSSLGGYYATWLAEKLGCRAVLLNPAINPARDLQAHLGRQPVYFTDQSIDMRPEYLDELREIDTPHISLPERYFLVAASGDELIDYRTMVARYPGCRQRVIQGSDHALSDFDEYLPEVLAFCGVA